MCPIRAEMSTHKHLEKCIYLLFVPSLVSDKITSIYCLILEILGQKCHFFTIRDRGGNDVL